MDKLTAIKIKYNDGTYSDEIPVSALSENVEWDSTHTLVDILGNIDVDVTGSIQDQISQLSNSKVNTTDLNNYVNSTMKTEVAGWLNNYISPATGTIAYDASLSIQGAAADAKAAGQIVQISTTKPTKENNRIWVGASEEEYEVPTMEDLDDLKEVLDNVRERTDNLVDCNSASKWIATSGKDVTVTIPDEDTVRIKSNISQTYAAARYEINTVGVNTLYTAIGAYSGDGEARARLYGSASGTITNLGTINVSGNVFDVSAYDTCIVELCATVATASDGYIDYSRVIVASSDIAVEYQPYYVYKADEAISKLSYVENVAKTAAEAAGTPPGKFYAIHRGARSTAPENTMPAFIRARQLGYKIIETDVRYTSDMVPVLIHDGTINRTARNADGTDLSETINIADITYEQALAYDFGIFKGQEYAGTKIPTLSEFLHWCKATGVTPVIEQKIRNNSEIDLVIDAIIEAGMETNFVSLSQTVGSLSRIYNRLPNGKFVLLNNSTITQEIIDSVSASIFIESIAGLYTSYTPELIESCKTANVALYAHDYYKYTDIYATDDYVSGYIVEEGAI